MSFGDTMLHVMLLPEKMSAIGQLVTSTLHYWFYLLTT